MFKPHTMVGNPFQTIDLRVINRTGDGLTVGEVVQFMLDIGVDGDTSPEAKGGGPGTPTGTGSFAQDAQAPAPFAASDGVFCNVDDVAAVSENLIRAFAVVIDLLDGSGNDNTEVLVRFQGPVTVNAASAAYACGAPLQVTTAANTVTALVAATGQRPIGFSLSEKDTTTSIDMMFFGWAGLIGGQHE